MGRCLCTIGGTTSCEVVMGTRRTIHPAKLYHACPGLVNGRSTHNARCRSFNKGGIGRAAVLPFAHLVNNPVSCAPNVFRPSYDGVGPGGGSRTHAALTHRLTLCIAVCDPLRVTTSIPRGCRHFVSTFRFVGSITIS